MGGSFSRLTCKYLRSIAFPLSVLTSALQVLLNPVTQDDDAMEGLGYVSELLLRCKVIEDTYLKSSIQGQRYLINFVKHSRGCQRPPKPVFALSTQENGVT